MQYRPRFSIYTPTEQLRWPMTWTPMALHEARDGKRVSGQNATRIWREGRKRLKRTHMTWDTVRLLRIGHRKPQRIDDRGTVPENAGSPA